MKSYLLGFWNVFDPIYYSFTRLRYVKDREENRTVFRVRLTRYKGRRTVLKDGTVINKNDLLMKIHLHNVKLMNELYAVKHDTKRAVYIYHIVKKAMPLLADYVQNHKRYEELKGIIGITTLHKGTKRLGFDNVPIQHPIYRTYKKITFTPINYLASSSSHNNPVYLFMSKDELVNRYSK
ncbi:YkoP family protein [Ornithinibacillus sp. 179-J 7C1 HS]|uniref:YkoP family protein n=1 Tax=Ornithinibacillus sp. 179-J 7C1 HS TaxID=3142384 RepID=UPI0039A19CC5